MRHLLSKGRSLAVPLLAAVLAAGCGGEVPSTQITDAPAPQTGNQALAASNATSASKRAQEGKAEPVGESDPKEQTDDDFSTPKAAVETFLAASDARDLDLLSRCFADNAPREFDGVRHKTATQEELDELAELMHGASVTDVRINESAETAVVDVKLSSRDEHISMRKIDAGWKIVDF